MSILPAHGDNTERDSRPRHPHSELITALRGFADVLADVPLAPIEAPPAAKVRGRDKDVERFVHALRGVELGAEDRDTIDRLAQVLDAQTKVIIQSWLERVRAAGGAS